MANTESTFLGPSVQKARILTPVTAIAKFKLKHGLYWTTLVPKKLKIPYGNTRHIYHYCARWVYYGIYSSTSGCGRECDNARAAHRLLTYLVSQNICSKSAVFQTLHIQYFTSCIHRKDSRIQLYNQHVAAVFWCWVMNWCWVMKWPWFMLYIIHPWHPII